jgi:hypothetical protein
MPDPDSRQNQQNPYSHLRPPENSCKVDNDSPYGARLLVQRAFKRGDLILPLVGRHAAPSYKTIQIGLNTHLEGSLTAFINHSCRPSAIIMTQEIAIRAWTDLEAGDEVTFFYPSTEWAMVRPFNCLCGAPDCIGYVAGAKYLPLSLLSRHPVSPHIRQLAGDVLASFSYASTPPR